MIAVVIVAVLGGGTFAAVELASDDDGDGGATTTTGSPPTIDVDPGERRQPEATTSTAAPAPGTAISSIRLATDQIATLSSPTALATRAGDDALYITEQAGRVARVAGGTASTVLDLSADVGSSGNEQGLLGIEFSPDGAFMYLDYTDAAGDTRVVEYAMADDRPQPDSRRELLSVDQPFENHNGGALAFGPDGFLYVSLGDGGSGGDPRGHGQNRGTLLGSILRILPRETDGAPYAVPSNNPFVGVEGAREEIWAYGLRNPWRITFDRETGDLWIADVGQDAIEEVDFQPASSTGGENYGWNRLEGSQPFSGSPPDEHVLPIHEYSHRGGNCSITGGYVYRGEAIPELRGVYLFIDFCGGDLMGLRREAGEAVEVGDLGLDMNQVSSFGEDESGELYVLQRTGGVFRLRPG